MYICIYIFVFYMCIYVCIYCVQYLCLSASKVLSSLTSFAKFCGLVSYLACCHKRVACPVVVCVCVCMHVCVSVRVC